MQCILYVCLYIIYFKLCVCVCVLLKVDSVYSQLGDTVSPPPVNGDLFRPSSVELPCVKEDHDGNTAIRMRSMSEAPKVKPYNKKKKSGPSVCVCVLCADLQVTILYFVLQIIRVTERPERLTYVVVCLVCACRFNTFGEIQQFRESKHTMSVKKFAIIIVFPD